LRGRTEKPGRGERVASESGRWEPRRRTRPLGRRWSPTGTDPFGKPRRRTVARAGVGAARNHPQV